MSDIHILETDLDLKQNLNIFATCRQLDTLHLIFNVYDNGLEADLTNYKVRLKAMKFDKVPLIQDTEYTVINNVVKIEGHEQLTTTSGKTPIELEFINKTTGERKATFNLVLKVQASVLEVDRTISKATYTLLEQLEDKLDQALDFVENIDEAIGANTNLIASTNTANLTKTALDGSNTTALATKSALDTSNTNATNAKNALNTSITNANNSKTALDTSKTNADASKTALDESIGEANDFVQAHQNIENLVNQVNQNTSSLSDIVQQQTTQNANISSLQNSVVTNTSNISTNNSNIATNATNINTQKSRIDNLIATSSGSFYQKCLNTDTGALLVVASGATTGQINLASVTPVATGYTPIAGDYVRLVYGVASGNAELVDARVQADGVIATNIGNAIRNQFNSSREDFGNYIPITWIENSFIHSWGTVVASDSYDCTDFISYSSKLKYKVRTKMENDLSRIAYYDDSKKMVKSVNLYSATLKEFDVEQIENCAYIRFSFYKGKDKTDSHSLSYCKVVSIFNNINNNTKKITQIENDLNSIKNFNFWSYAISNAILIGDSLTSGAYPTEEWGADAQPNDSIAQNIPYYLKRMLNLDNVVNAGKSGYSASDWYISRIQNQPLLYNFSNFDCAIIWLGTNNGLTDTITTEGTEANYYHKIIERIREQNSNCLIILVKVFASKGDVTTTNTIIDKIANEYNCLVINNSDLTVSNYPQLHVNNATNNPHFGKAGNIFIANRYACEISKYLYESPIRCEFGITKRTD